MTVSKYVWQKDLPNVECSFDTPMLFVPRHVQVHVLRPGCHDKMKDL